MLDMVPFALLRVTIWLRATMTVTLSAAKGTISSMGPLSAVSRVLLIPLITPLVAVGLGVMFLGESVGWGTAVGGTAILAGVGMAVWNGGRH
jgi:drug/metabolite transporter (DMT)-like permease